MPLLWNEEVLLFIGTVEYHRGEAGSMTPRICKRCLLRDLAEEDQKDLKKYLAAIKPAERASEALYEERLAVCRECDLLAEATCEACGCYVEFRAYAAISRCPKKKW